jgi:hypothetical protein
MCSLRFDMEENTIIEAFVRFRFASVAITMQGATAAVRTSDLHITRKRWLFH